MSPRFVPPFRNLHNYEEQANWEYLEEFLAELLPGPWTNPTNFSAKLEEHASLQVRTEQAKTVMRLKGVFKTKEAIPAFTLLFQLPVGPPEEIVTFIDDLTGAPGVRVIRIKPNGVVENENELAAAHYFGFHGKTYNLT